MVKNPASGIPHITLIGGLVGGIAVPFLKTEFIDKYMPADWGIGSDIALLALGFILFMFGGRIHRFLRYFGMGIVIVQGADLIRPLVT